MREVQSHRGYHNGARPLVESHIGIGIGIESPLLQDLSPLEGLRS
jgi:hypothetical protein